MYILLAFLIIFPMNSMFSMTHGAGAPHQSDDGYLSDEFVPESPYNSDDSSDDNNENLSEAPYVPGPWDILAKYAPGVYCSVPLDRQNLTSRTWLLWQLHQLEIRYNHNRGAWAEINHATQVVMNEIRLINEIERVNRAEPVDPAEQVDAVEPVGEAEAINQTDLFRAIDGMYRMLATRSFPQRNTVAATTTVSSEIVPAPTVPAVEPVEQTQFSELQGTGPLPSPEEATTEDSNRASFWNIVKKYAPSIYNTLETKLMLSSPGQVFHSPNGLRLINTLKKLLITHKDNPTAYAEIDRALAAAEQDRENGAAARLSFPRVYQPSRTTLSPNNNLSPDSAFSGGRSFLNTRSIQGKLSVALFGNFPSDKKRKSEKGEEQSLKRIRFNEEMPSHQTNITTRPTTVPFTTTTTTTTTTTATMMPSTTIPSVMVTPPRNTTTTSAAPVTPPAGQDNDWNFGHSQRLLQRRQITPERLLQLQNLESPRMGMPDYIVFTQQLEIEDVDASFDNDSSSDESSLEEEVTPTQEIVAVAPEQMIDEDEEVIVPTQAVEEEQIAPTQIMNVNTQPIQQLTREDRVRVLRQNHDLGTIRAALRRIQDQRRPQ